MLKITIDNQPIEIEEGMTILDAARQAGIEIPALCHLHGHHAPTSCLVCLVKVNGRARYVPSCATKVEDGMVVESETAEVRAARRMALELLLGDHTGDCIGPCQSVCPAHLDIPLMLRQIAGGELRAAIITIKAAIPLPATLGRICPNLCERGCRRAARDSAVAICLLKRYAADADLASGSPYLPACAPATGKRVAIVGAGPAGLSAAYYLRLAGHACTIFDAQAAPGGMLRYGVPEARLPRGVLDTEIALIARLGVEFRPGVRVGRDLSLEQLQREYDAILLATGAVTGENPALAATAGKGLQVDKRTRMTGVPAVFAAGSAVSPSQHAVRAVADGRVAALAIGQFLADETITGYVRPFTVHMGQVSAEELRLFMVDASAAGRSAGMELTEAEARAEAGRCLHCDCRKPDACKLRQQAMAYDASPTAFKSERRPFTRCAATPR